MQILLLFCAFLVGCGNIHKSYQSKETFRDEHVGWGLVSFRSPAGISVVDNNLGVSPSEFAWIVYESKRNFRCENVDLAGSIVVFQKAVIDRPFGNDVQASGMSWKQIAPPYKWNAVVQIDRGQRLCATSLPHELGHIMNIECYHGAIDGCNERDKNCELAINKRIVTCQN